jgi:hypothetical protein
MDGVQCVAITGEGERCEIRSGLCPEHRMCLWHDECRTEQAEKARSLAGRTTAKRARTFARKSASAKPSVRVVDLAQLPPLESLADAVRASAFLYQSAATGVTDPATTREALRAVTTYVNAIHKSDLQRRIRELEKQLKQLQRSND